MPNYNVVPGEIYSLGIDCASRPYGQAVQDSPYSLICRYLSDGGRSLPGKQLKPDEARSYLDHDIAIVSNWETYETRMNEGYNAGVADAKSAWAQHKACGGPDDATVYFSADYDVPEGDQPAINAYLQGAIDYLGIQSVGIYGGYWVCKRAKEYNRQIKLWQTLAWSGGNIHPEVNLLQRIGFVTVGGCQCDVNEIRTPGATGAWQDVIAPPPPPAPQPQPEAPVKNPLAVEDSGKADDRLKLILDQLLIRWEMLGNRTVVEALAEILKRTEK